MNNKAFSLIELLVVIAIIVLLISILVPSLSHAQEIARRAQCAANLHALGIAWHMYFTNNNQLQPRLSYFNNRNSDYHSQFNYLIYFANKGWCNAGKLYESEYVDSKDVFLCPTIVKNMNMSGRWFSDNGGWTNSDNPWVPRGETSSASSRMTYGTRRMKFYDDPAYAWDPACKFFEFRHNSSLNWAENPSNFSFMADCFSTRSSALASHVPGVNVLYFDGHVGFFTDDDGTVLYDNGIGEAWGMNWEHDNIWINIDRDD